MATRQYESGGARPEDYFRVLVEQAADGIFVANDEGRYLEVNPSGHRLLGYPPGELVGMGIKDVVRPQDGARLALALDALRAGRTDIEEWLMVRKDGSQLEAEVTAQKLSSGMFLAIVRDVSERRRIESEIRASEARSRSVLATAPDTIMMVDRAGTIQFINRVFAPLTMEQVVGSCCFDYVPPESRARVVTAIEHVFSTRGFDEYEIQGPPDVSGERIWTSVRAGPMIHDGRVVAATLCATDIRERRRAEARRQELLERLEKISSQIPGMVYQYKLRPDGSSCFPYASARIREIYRVTPDEVREDASKVFGILHPDDYAGIVDSITASATSMTQWSYEYRVKFPNGDVRWLNGNSTPERQQDGSILWHGFITDVTLRKEADQNKVHLEEQLRQSQKVESIGRLAGGVAHDFNNLLTSVLGFTELALREVPKGSEVAANLDCVIESAQRGAELTQQLLAFARKKVVKPQVVDLNEILNKMAPMIRRLVGEQLELAVSLSADLHPVKVDVGSIEQVVMNLVVNARDAITGGGRITLATANRVLDEEYARANSDLPAGDYVTLVVTDNGVGMNADVQARIFEPFFTTKPLGQGTGLGLATCHGIVKQAGGNISVYSEPGRGSTFRVYLPRATGKSMVMGEPEVHPLTVTGTETVLLVEDEETILRVAREGLASFGYRVLGARDGVHALEIARGTDDPIHLLITDVVMPRMGGRELTRLLMDLRPGLKVLYSSGYAESAIVEHGVLEEGVNFLQKPYTPTALAKRVREVLDRA